MARLLALTISRFGTVLPEVMMFGNVQWNSKTGRSGKVWRGVDEDAPKCKPGNVFKDIGVFHGLGGVFAPGKGGMPGNQDAGNGQGIKVFRAEAADDDGGGVADIT